MPVGGGPTGGWCVVCGDCGCGAGGHGRPTGGRREACWGMWLRCRWAAAGPGRASRSIIPSRKARVWRSRGRAAAHRRIEQPQKARRVLAPHGSLAGCAARRSGGVGRAEVWRWCAERSSLCEGSGRRSVAHRRIEQPQKARRVLASCGGLAGWVAWTASGRAGLAPHGDLAGCAIMLPRLAIARARTPVLSPAACTTLEGSS